MFVESSCHGWYSTVEVPTSVTFVFNELLSVPGVGLAGVHWEEVLVLGVGLCLGGPPEADLFPQLLQGGQVGDGPGVTVIPVLRAQDDD